MGGGPDILVATGRGSQQAAGPRFRRQLFSLPNDPTADAAATSDPMSDALEARTLLGMACLQYLPRPAGLISNARIRAQIGICELTFYDNNY